MGIDFSTEVRQASTVFTQYRNTINIYTEDCGKDKKFYVTLFKRLLNDTDIIINDIYPLGNCTNVINPSLTGIIIFHKFSVCFEGFRFAKYLIISRSVF